MGNTLAGIGSAVGAAGDIYSIFNKPKASPESQLSLEAAKLHAPFTGLISTPTYNFGGGVLTRRNNDFLNGQRRLRSDIQGLRAQVKPGFGQLTQTGVNAIRQRAAEAAGNLRSNLASRGLLGASFASDAQGRVDQEFGQLEQQFRAQAFQEEMAANHDLIDQEQQSLTAQVNQELTELGVATSFLSGVNQAAVTQADIAKQLTEENLLKKYGAPGAKPPSGAAGSAGAPAAPAAPAPSRLGTRQPAAAPAPATTRLNSSAPFLRNR
jgi:hypothetical protein